MKLFSEVSACHDKLFLLMEMEMTIFCLREAETSRPLWLWDVSTDVRKSMVGQNSKLKDRE